MLNSSPVIGCVPKPHEDPKGAKQVVADIGWKKNKFGSESLQKLKSSVRKLGRVNSLSRMCAQPACLMDPRPYSRGLTKQDMQFITD